MIFCTWQLGFQGLHTAVPHAAVVKYELRVAQMPAQNKKRISQKEVFAGKEADASAEGRKKTTAKCRQRASPTRRKIDRGRQKKKEKKKRSFCHACQKKRSFVTFAEKKKTQFRHVCKKKNVVLWRSLTPSTQDQNRNLTVPREMCCGPTSP